MTMVNSQPSVSDATIRAVTDWLFSEAELLDTNRYRDWLKLVTADLQYSVPLRVTREREADSDIVEGIAHMDDDWDAMEMRILRLETEYAWAEQPPSRSRRFVTNIRVRQRENPEELFVTSSLLLYRTRGDVPTYDVLSGQRRDVLRWMEEQLRLASREVLLDQTTIMTHNLSLIM